MHISNRNLELASVAAGVAEANGMIARIYDGGDVENDPSVHHWVPRIAVIARQDEDFGALAKSEFWPLHERDPEPAHLDRRLFEYRRRDPAQSAGKGLVRRPGRRIRTLHLSRSAATRSTAPMKLARASCIASPRGSSTWRWRKKPVSAKAWLRSPVSGSPFHSVRRSAGRCSMRSCHGSPAIRDTARPDFGET